MRRWQTKTRPTPGGGGGGGGSLPSSPEQPWRSRFRWLLNSQWVWWRLQVQETLPDEQKEDWHQWDWIYLYFAPQMPMQMWPMRSGALMYRGGWTSMMKWVCCPHIFGSLQGYPGKWACSLPGGMNISLDELLRWHGLYIWEHVHWLWQDDLVIVWEKTEGACDSGRIHAESPWSGSSGEMCTYPDQVPNEGEGLRRDHFYYRLIPSPRDVHSASPWLIFWRENKWTLALTLSTIWPRN